MQLKDTPLWPFWLNVGFTWSVPIMFDLWTRVTLKTVHPPEWWGPYMIASFIAAWGITIPVYIHKIIDKKKRGTKKEKKALPTIGSKQ